MHDIKAIRTDPAGFDAALRRRGLAPASDRILEEDRALRSCLTEMQAMQAERNGKSRQIGQLRRQGEDTAALEAEVVGLKGRMDAISDRIASLERGLRTTLAELPNILDPDVPEGADETANLVVRQHGEKPSFAFNPRQHFELGEALGMMSFDDATRLAGSRFTVLRGALARLERALGQFMLDLHTTEHGYTETSVPLLVNEAAMFGTNQLPKFADEAFQTTDGRWLIPTAEVALTNLAAGQIISQDRLPIRVTALTPCFRSEAGAAGRDTRGMLRQHQFLKCELVSITTPETSDAEHERMTRAAETVLERLGLPYRRMLLCAGDTGFGAARTYDLEVWLPGQGAWREISSCSNTRAFQARRMNARLRAAEGEVRHVHTLNGSGVAVGRALIAVMENNQRADGTIAVPPALIPYMSGQHHIEA